MEFDLRALEVAKRYKLLASSITPRPIAWVTSRSADGIHNAAPYSFFNMMGSDPPTVVLGLMLRPEGGLKDSAVNITTTGEFVINLVCEADAEAMNLTCIDAPPEVDECALAGLELLPSRLVGPPRIASAPVSLECRVLETVYPGGEGGQVIVIGEVLMAHIADQFVLDADRCHLDTLAMGLIGRVHGAGWYVRMTDLFQMDRPVWPAEAPGSEA